jgi:hypothetical protein
MFGIALLDMAILSIWVCFGWFQFFGVVYCSLPTVNYMLGCIYIGRTLILEISETLILEISPHTEAYVFEK